MELKRRIKFEADLDRGFADWIVNTRGGERLRSCIQCGTCSATCPLSMFMDYTPRRLINMAREGFHKEILSSVTPWLCASCYSCTVECPQQIQVTDVMYAIKRRALQEGVYPKDMPVSILAREFFGMVRTHGRTNEAWLVMRMYLKQGLGALVAGMFRMASLGIGLIRTGRFSLRQEKITKRKELKALLDNLDRSNGRRTGREVTAS